MSQEIRKCYTCGTNPADLIIPERRLHSDGASCRSCRLTRKAMPYAWGALGAAVCWAWTARLYLLIVALLIVGIFGVLWAATAVNDFERKP